MDSKTRSQIATSLRAAAAKLSAATVSPPEKAALRTALTDAVRKVVASQRFIQDLNETVEFPERFNQDGELAVIKEVVIENNGTRIIFMIGNEEWSFQIGAPTISPTDR